MTDPILPSRRGALALGAGLAAFAALPAFAQDAAEADLASKGYALGDVVLGQADAPVTIIEYASLTCPHCANFHEVTYPEIKAKYIDTGKAKLILREVYFDQFGLWAAMTARCGGEMSYYRMVNSFLGKQKTWYLDHVRAYNQTKNAGPIIEEIMKIGRLAGLSNERMNSCLNDQALLERMVTDFQTTSAEDNVTGTPTFFINGDLLKGESSVSAMSAAIDKHL